jgi:hypothetical protein
LKREEDEMKKTLIKPIVIGAVMLTLIGGAAYVSTENVYANVTSSAETGTVQQIKHPLKWIGQFSEGLQTLLKLDKAALQEKLSSGQTLAQVAAAQGITRDALKAELTKQANTEMENQRKEFTTNVDQVIDSTNLGKMGDRKGPHGMGPGKQAGKHGMHKDPKFELTPVASLLGYATETELKEALKSGSSLADLASTQKVDVQKVIDQVKTQIQKQLDQKLADGTITKTHYDERKAGISQKVTEIVNHQHKQKR